MSRTLFDERDIHFLVNECIGLKHVMETEGFEEFDGEQFAMVFDQILQFAGDYLAPNNGAFDRQGCTIREGVVQTPEGFKALWEQYLSLGLTGITANPEFGGAGMPHLFAAAVSELECGACLSFSMIALLTREAANLIERFGSESLKERTLEKMFSGEWTGTMCLTEPQAGSDVGAAATKATPQGDVYLISGTKSFISWGEHDLTPNIVHLVLARIPGAPAGTKGLSLFVVPKFRVDDEGQLQFNDVTCSTIEHKMGIKASPTCVLNFGENQDCQGYLLGEPHQGIKYMFQMMNAARNEVGLQGLAVAAVAYQHAVAYAATRKQGSLSGSDQSVTIDQHPDVRHMLLRMRALVQAMRSMLYHGAYFQDISHHEAHAAHAKAMVELMTPINKAYGSDMGFRVTELSMQVFGGYGFCCDYPVEQLMRDVKITSIYEGTNGIQAMDLLFRKILGSKGSTLQALAAEIESIGNRCPEALGDLLETLKKTFKGMVGLCQIFGQWAAEQQIASLQFVATDLLRAFGHLMGAVFLLKGAATAMNADPELKDAFYRDKVQTARYFYDYILPEAITALSVLNKNPKTFVGA